MLKKILVTSSLLLATCTVSHSQINFDNGELSAKIQFNRLNLDKSENFVSTSEFGNPGIEFLYSRVLHSINKNSLKGGIGLGRHSFNISYEFDDEVQLRRIESYANLYQRLDYVFISIAIERTLINGKRSKVSAIVNNNLYYVNSNNYSLSSSEDFKGLRADVYLANTNRTSVAIGPEIKYKVLLDDRFLLGFGMGFQIGLYPIFEGNIDLINTENNQLVEKRRFSSNLSGAYFKTTLNINNKSEDQIFPKERKEADKSDAKFGITVSINGTKQRNSTFNGQYDVKYGLQSGVGIGLIKRKMLKNHIFIKTKFGIEVLTYNPNVEILPNFYLKARPYRNFSRSLALPYVAWCIGKAREINEKFTLESGLQFNLTYLGINSMSRASVSTLGSSTTHDNRILLSNSIIQKYFAMHLGPNLTFTKLTEANRLLSFDVSYLIGLNRNYLDIEHAFIFDENVVSLGQTNSRLSYLTLAVHYFIK